MLQLAALERVVTMTEGRDPPPGAPLQGETWRRQQVEAASGSEDEARFVPIGDGPELFGCLVGALEAIEEAAIEDARAHRAAAAALEAALQQRDRAEDARKWLRERVTEPEMLRVLAAVAGLPEPIGDDRWLEAASDRRLGAKKRLDPKKPPAPRGLPAAVAEALGAALSARVRAETGEEKLDANLKKAIAGASKEDVAGAAARRDLAEHAVRLLSGGSSEPLGPLTDRLLASRLQLEQWFAGGALARASDDLADLTARMLASGAWKAYREAAEAAVSGGPLGSFPAWQQLVRDVFRSRYAEPAAAYLTEFRASLAARAKGKQPASADPEKQRAAIHKKLSAIEADAQGALAGAAVDAAAVSLGAYAKAASDLASALAPGPPGAAGALLADRLSRAAKDSRLLDLQSKRGGGLLSLRHCHVLTPPDERFREFLLGPYRAATNDDPRDMGRPSATLPDALSARAGALTGGGGKRKRDPLAARATPAGRLEWALALHAAIAEHGGVPRDDPGFRETEQRIRDMHVETVGDPRSALVDFGHFTPRELAEGEAMEA